MAVQAKRFPGLYISQTHRQLQISCRGGLLEMEAGWGDTFWRKLHVNPEFDDFNEVPIDKANDLIARSIKELIGAQYYFLSGTNNNKSVTKTLDKMD